LLKQTLYVARSLRLGLDDPCPGATGVLGGLIGTEIVDHDNSGRKAGRRTDSISYLRSLVSRGNYCNYLVIRHI
jgi:hypothetical protein